MSAPDNTPEWLGGIAAVITLGLTYLRKVFVTNRELQHILEKHEEQREKQRLELHRENLANFNSLFERMGKVEQSQARMEGMLSGRYPRLDR